MFLLKTTVSYEYAHRLYDVATYTEDCKNNIHGHSGYLTVYITRPELNAAGMVMDFKQLKEILKEEIESKYDHSCILKSNDPVAPVVKDNCKKVHIVEENPTAEWMAYRFFTDVNAAVKKIDPKVSVWRVEVQETDKNIAIYQAGSNF